MPPPVISVEIGSVKANRQIKSIAKNIGDLKLEVNRLSRSVKAINFSKMGSKKVAGDVATLNNALRKTTVSQVRMRKGLDKVKKSADKTSKSLKGAKGRVTELSKSIQIALGPLSGVAARLTAFSGLATGAGIAIAALVAGVIALAFAFVKTVNAGKDMEKQLLVIGGLIKSTGSAAGLTVFQVNQLSQSIAFSTLAGVNQAREAAAVLLTFVAITGKEFKRTLRLAQDLAQLGFGSMRNAAVQLGKALEDPAIGLSALRRVGVSFTPVLREQIILLAELGRSAEAAALTLKTIEEQTGGVGKAAATGLTGAIDNLGDSFTRFFETLSKQKDIINILSRLARGTSKFIDLLNEGVRAPTGPELNANVNRARERLRRQVERLGPALESTNPQVMTMVQRMIDPLLKELFDAEDALSLKISEFNKEFAKQQAAETESKINKARQNLNRLKETFNKLKESIDPGFKATKDFNKAIKTLKEALDKDIIPLEEYNRLVGRAEIRQSNAARSAIFWNKALREQQKIADQANRTLKRLIETRNRAFEATEQQIDSLLRESQALLISGKERKVALEVLKAEIRLKKAGIDITRVEIQLLLERVRKAAELKQETIAAVKDETEALKDFTRVIGTAFEDALTKGASFRDLLKSIEEDLIRIVTRIAITKPFEAALTTAIQGGKLDKNAEGIEKLGFGLGSLLRNIFGFGNQKKQDELAATVADAQAKAALASGKFAINTDIASTAVQDLAKAAVQASIALRQIQLVKPGGGIGDILGSSGISGAIGLGSTGLDFQGFGGTVGGFVGPFGKGGIAGSRGRVNVHNFDSGGIADNPSVAVFAEKRGQKEAFVPLPNSGKIPVELGGDIGGGIIINGPLMIVETRDAESFEQSGTQIASNILGLLQRSQRNM